MLVAQGEAAPMVRGLNGHIFASDRSGVKVDIGQFRDEQWYTSSYWLSKPGGQTDDQINLNWRGTIAELAVYEKMREGRPPEFHIQLRGELCYLLNAGESDYRNRSEPLRIYGEVQIAYPKELWVGRLRSLGVLENVLVEIPLPSAPPAPWDEVWQSLVAARNAFEQGGTTGWKGCVSEVRVALEKWRTIEPEDISQANQRARTKQQRLDFLRWHLHSCAHYWIHSPDERCSREDALLVLSTFSSLLLERNP